MVTRPYRRFISAFAAAAIALATVSIAAPAAAQTAGFPSVGDRFAQRGPYSVTIQREPTHTYYSPAVLGQGGVRHPVILWGNGTTARPFIYELLLQHFASHGFVVAAADTPDAGTGIEMLAGLDNLARFNSEPGNRFFGVVDLTRVGTTGHSQGGGGAVEAGSDPRVDTIFPLQGDRGAAAAVRGPALMMAGEWDTLVKPAEVHAAYQALRTAGGYAELRYATHLTPLLDGGGFRFAATAWARWQLMDDPNGRAQFVGSRCGLCTSGAWKFDVNAAFPTG